MTTSSFLPVIEIFGPTIQGEGILAGRPSNFIRFGGCSYRCSWCDSMHAVDPEQVKKNATWMLPTEIYQKIVDLKNYAHWITLSGGDPVMWDLTHLISILLNQGHHVALETQGALWADWVPGCDEVTVSPKPPSSGMADKINHLILGKYVEHCRMSFKIVIFDFEDLEFARALAKRYSHTRMFLSVGTRQNTGKPIEEDVIEILMNYRTICEAVLREPEGFELVTVLPQLHVLMWGHKQGV